MWDIPTACKIKLLYMEEVPLFRVEQNAAQECVSIDNLKFSSDKNATR